MSLSQVSIIIPFFNESETIPLLIKELNIFVNENKNNIELEVIFVNDGSTDDSFEILKKQILYCRTKLIQLTSNRGSHIAFRAGLQHASFDIVTQTSSDLQNPLYLISEMLFIIKNSEKKLVIAKRINTENIGFLEQSFSRVYTFFIRKFAIQDYPEGGFDIFMFNKEIKQLVNSNVENNSSLLLQILSLGYKYGVVSYKKNIRINGKSKWTLSKKIKLLIDSFVAFSYAPIRLVSFVGVLFFMFGVIWTIYIFTRKIIYNDIASGWPMLTSILLLGFGITNIGLGIIAEYLWRTLDASRKRPVFIIDEIIELKK